MAKKSIIEREIKRENLSRKYLEKRKSLKSEIEGVDSFEKKIIYQSILQKLPRNSALCRHVS